MKRSIALLTAAVLATGALAGPAFSQGAAQTVALVKVDLKSLASGYRSSKIVGATVVNENNDTVGKIDDLLVTAQERVPFAIVSVGGFLGVGDKLVAIPFDAVQVSDKQVLLRGATKQALKDLPEFKYSK